MYNHRQRKGLKRDLNAYAHMAHLAARIQHGSRFKISFGGRKQFLSHCYNMILISIKKELLSAPFNQILINYTWSGS